MSSCIYAGSFDPVTKGHLDIIARAARVFERVVVLVATNPRKTYTFNIRERVNFIQRAVLTMQSDGSDLASLLRFRTIEVLPFKDQLVADYAYMNGIKTIVKGVRGNQDFDYEKLLHEISISQQAGIDTHILFSREGLHHVSSSAAKDLCRYQGLIADNVTLDVKQSLEKSINEQHIIGVTGVIGAGKSYVSAELKKTLNNDFAAPGRVTQSAHNIELDHLAHEILFGTSDNEPFAFSSLRHQIQDEFKINFWGRKFLGEVVFNNPDKLARLNQLMKNPMQTMVRKAIAGRKGLIILNGALLVEAGYLDMCNNNIVLLTASEEVTRKRLADRGMTPEQIDRRLASQLTSKDKQSRIESKIQKDGWGSLIIKENSYNKSMPDLKLEPSDTVSVVAASIRKLFLNY